MIRKINTKNIFGKDINEIYKNCETENSITGGFFPVGITGRWHSGIHVIQDCVYPLISGKLVAYRNCKLNNKEEDFGANFYLVEHEITETDIKFYTLYFNIASTDRVLSDIVSDGNFVNEFTNLKYHFIKIGILKLER